MRLRDRLPEILIESEMRANQAEVGKMRASMNSNIARLATAAQDRIGNAGNLSVDMSLALLSEAAWHATLDTGAVQHVDYAWTMEVAKVYGLQELVMHAQCGVLDQISDRSDEKKWNHRTPWHRAC